MLVSPVCQQDQSEALLSCSLYERTETPRTTLMRDSWKDSVIALRELKILEVKCNDDTPTKYTGHWLPTFGTSAIADEWKYLEWVWKFQQNARLSFVL